MGAGAIFYAILVVLGGILLYRRIRRPSEPSWDLADLRQRLDRLDLLLLDGDLEEAAAILTRIEPTILKIQGPDGTLLRARLHIAAGAFFVRTARREAAIQRFRSALPVIDTLADTIWTTELKALAEAWLGLLAADSTSEPELVSGGRHALDAEPAVRRHEVLMRLVWVAHHLGEIEFREGRWGPARSLLERCVAIARRLERPEPDAPGDAPDAEARERSWSWGRKVASEAARDLGAVLLSLGDRERGMSWCDQAIELVEGARLPVARLRLAQALIDRAVSEPVDAFTGIGTHEALLERAVAVGLSCNDADGRTLACRAEAARAGLYPPLGMTDRALEHLRAALALTDQMTEPAAGANLTYLHAEIGAALEATGDVAGALDALQEAVARGRVHPDPDIRLLAVQAAGRRHHLLIRDDRVDEAREAVEAIEQLVPTLPARSRPTFAVIAAHARGIQHLFEGHLDEARARLARAESLARQGDDAFHARSAAADLGRLELRAGRPEAAEGHLRRALDTEVPQEGGAERRSRLAQIQCDLAHALMDLERFEEALRESAVAYEMGRGAGDAAGREVAAVAALSLAGGAAEDDERVRYLESAARFGRLCGSPRGREIADAAEARLREGPE